MAERLGKRAGLYKNILITALVALALVQTYFLWFPNASSRSRIAAFGSWLQAAKDETRNSFVSPYRILTNSGAEGGGYFHIQYNGINDSEIKLACDELIVSAVRDSAYEGGKPLDYKELYREPSVIYEYAFPIPSGLFAEGFGLRNAGLAQITECVEAVVISPAEGGAKVIFVGNGEAHEYGVGENFEIPEAPQADIRYESSALAGYDYFAENVFIPRFPSGSYQYPSIVIVNPYVPGERLRHIVLENVAHLFANPAAIIPYTGANSVYTYSDENTVVKYYRNDVLEYSCYKYPGNGNPSLFDNYRAATAFINADKMIVNETFLAGYETDGEKTSFYFDYAINNMRIILPEAAITDAESPVRHAVEITMANETVVSYKKHVYNYLIDYTSAGRASLGFDGFLKETPDWADRAPGAFYGSAPVLGYSAGSRSQAFLYWFMDIGGEPFYVSAQ